VWMNPKLARRFAAWEKLLFLGNARRSPIP
jgi:hypothetical protein